MHHSKAEILRDLDPTNPATIQALIDHHRTGFGGWTMEGDEDPKNTGGDSPNPDESKDEPKGDKPDDKPLGPNGEKALTAERDARKAIEAELAQFKAGLAAALGVKDKDAKSSTDDVLATVQAQLAMMQRENLVLSVAGSHKITDEDDLGLLRDFKGDDEALRKLAARLKPADDSNGGQGQKKRAPGPDLSQGKGGNGSGKPGDAGRAEAARRFAKAAATT